MMQLPGEQTGGEASPLAEVGMNARQRRDGVLADRLVVIHADDGHFVRHGNGKKAACGQRHFGDGIVGGQDPARLGSWREPSLKKGEPFLDGGKVDGGHVPAVEFQRGTESVLAKLAPGVALPSDERELAEPQREQFAGGGFADGDGVVGDACCVLGRQRRVAADVQGVAVHEEGPPAQVADDIHQHPSIVGPQVGQIAGLAEVHLDGDVFVPEIDPVDPRRQDQPGELLKVGKKGTTAVYSAPYGKSAWRAGKGKAAVGLNGDIWLLSQYRNEDGQSYACIRYNVSERTQRIGYALCKDLGLPEITDWHPDEPLTGFAHVDVEANTDTWLTDDPDVSQYQQFKVPTGTQFSCLGLYNDYYAYVSAEVKNDKFVDGGAIVWGFVPIRDLKPIEQEKQSEAMSKLFGNWKMEAGGSMADDYLVFNSDGTFTAGMWDWDLDTAERVENAARASGTWHVTKYNPFMNLYWNKPPYQLTLLYNNGRVTIRGLDFDDEGFSLTNAEGGGGYIPATEEDVQLTEDHG